jgi:hypothetical protein
MPASKEKSSQDAVSSSSKGSVKCLSGDQGVTLLTSSVFPRDRQQGYRSNGIVVSTKNVFTSTSPKKKAFWLLDCDYMGLGSPRRP